MTTSHQCGKEELLKVFERRIGNQFASVGNASEQGTMDSVRTAAAAAATRYSY